MSELAVTHLGSFTVPSTTSQMQVNVSGYSQYTHIELDISVVGTTDNYFRIRFNSDSSGSYDYVRLTGGGLANLSTDYFPGDTVMSTNASQTNSMRLMILEAYRTDVFKKWIDYGGATQWNSRANMSGGNWRQTSALSTIDIRANSGLIAPGTTVSVYGWIG